eukprot:8042061-Pyramimonas_sp.AAC.1
MGTASGGLPLQLGWGGCGSLPPLGQGGATTVSMLSYTVNASLSWGFAVFPLVNMYHVCGATLSMPRHVALRRSCSQRTPSEATESLTDPPTKKGRMGDLW